MKDIKLQPLKDDDKEQFILDNQEAFRYGATEEFGMRDDHFEEDGEIISRATIEKAISEGDAYRIICNGEIAVGAKRRHILMQFLCEACILSVLGGVIGLLLSFGAVQIYNLFSATAVAVNWTIGMVAIGFCAVIGVLFGGYPAAKASRLQPIDALHTT